MSMSNPASTGSAPARVAPPDISSPVAARRRRPVAPPGRRLWLPSAPPPSPQPLAALYEQRTKTYRRLRSLYSKQDEMEGDARRPGVFIGDREGRRGITAAASRDGTRLARAPFADRLPSRESSTLDVNSAPSSSAGFFFRVRGEHVTENLPHPLIINARARCETGLRPWGEYGRGLFFAGRRM
jgi:hypothetical protein